MQSAENVQANWQEGYCFIMTMPDPHTVRPTQERNRELQRKLLEYPPYSSELALSDFHLFGPLKNQIGVICLADEE
jgi:hypothetical protein